MERRNKLSIVIVVLAMLGALFATAGIAAGNEPVFVDRGVLLLHTNDSGFKVEWYDVGATSPTKTQRLLIDAKCNVTLDGPNLVAITPSGGTGKVGAVSHGLGVKTKNNCSTEQGQIALGQSLKISLGTYFKSKIKIDFAEIDVEGKRNAQVSVTYLPAATTQILPLSNTSSDNGPDSGASDNSIVVLAPAAKFRSVEFSPVMVGTNSPAISIEGGGDGPVSAPEPTPEPPAPGSLRKQLNTNASAFKLVEEFDGLLNCGDSTPTEGNGIIDAAITVTRGGQENCAKKPYNDDSAGSTASFEPTGQTNAQFTATVAWPAESAVLPVPVTNIDFDGPTGTRPAEPVQWCGGTPTRNQDGTLTMAAATATIPFAFVGPPTLPANTPWCLLDQDVTYTGGGMMQVTEYYYGSGDPFFAR